MSRMKFVGIGVCVVVLAAFAVSAQATMYVPLQFDLTGNPAAPAPAVDYIWSGIPFFWVQEVMHVQSPAVPNYQPNFQSLTIPISLGDLDLSSVNRIHFATASAFSMFIPNDVLTADITADYASGHSIRTLVMGIDTADWAHDRPGQSFAHTMPDPFYSFPAPDGGYDAHYFYVHLDTLAGEELVGITLTIRPETYQYTFSGQEITGITLEGAPVPEPASITLIGAGVGLAAGMTMIRRKIMRRK